MIVLNIGQLVVIALLKYLFKFWLLGKPETPKCLISTTTRLLFKFQRLLVFPSSALAGDQSSRSFTTASNSAGGGRKSRVAHQLILSLIISHLDLAHAEAVHVCNKEIRQSSIIRRRCLWAAACLVQTVAPAPESVIVHLGVSRLERLIGQGGRQKGTRSGGSWCTRPPRRGAFYVSPLSDARPDLKPETDLLFFPCVCVTSLCELHSSA